LTKVRLEIYRYDLVSQEARYEKYFWSLSRFCGKRVFRTIKLSKNAGCGMKGILKS
jgi:hypothetical protein